MASKVKNILLALVMLFCLIPSQTVLAVENTAATAGVSGTSVYRGTDYSAVYNCDYYSSHNPDLVAIYGNNGSKYIDHFINTGLKEGRQAIESFDITSYKNANPDLRVMFRDNVLRYVTHYLLSGKDEGRRAIGVDTLIDPIHSYAGIELSPIYDYDTYMTANPDLAGLYAGDDVAALDHFLKHGLLEGRYAKTNPNMALAEEIKKFSGIVGNEVTAYRGIDLSSIFEPAYYLMKNPDVAAAIGYDPKAAMDHFILSGLDEGRVAKASFDPAVYEQLKEAVKITGTLDVAMADKANDYDTSTGYIIMVDKANKRVAILSGRKGNYAMVKSFPCAIGAGSSPTPSGVYHMGIRGLYFDTGTRGRCWYYTQIKGNYLFHSQIYDRQSSPVNLIDGSMGVAVSHGCIRLNLENAKWMYNTMPSGSTIVIY